MVAAGGRERLREVGLALIVYSLAVPVMNGVIVVLLAIPAGLRPGSVLVLGAAGASASFINGPALVRTYFPTARPAVYLTAALGITFPFLLVLGLPLLQWLVVALAKN